MHKQKKCKRSKEGEKKKGAMTAPKALNREYTP